MGKSKEDRYKEHRNKHHKFYDIEKILNAFEFRRFQQVINKIIFEYKDN